MLDIIKLMLIEVKHVIDTAKVVGAGIDEDWFLKIKSHDFILRLTEKAQNQGFTASDLLACFDLGDQVPTYLEAFYQHILWRHYPKVGVAELFDGVAQKANVFFPLFRAYHNYGLKLMPEAFLAKYPFRLLKEDEIESLEDATEYRLVQKAFVEDYVYEMMVLNSEIRGFSTVDHISGVHYLAMFIGRQLKACGVNIDLGWVSGAAALHDIGKFGCLPEEVKKVAYYHYYYSDLWFRDRNITYIRQIAVNHSTWDLELANLPIESLVLIYADFRVKGHEDPSWPYPMKFFDLHNSFHVILEKLDNVDADKEKRYKKVYEKLRDFELYIESLGVKTDWQNASSPETFHWLSTDMALLDGEKIYKRLRTTAVAHNIAAMHIFRNENSLLAFLNHAKNLEDAHAMRRHVHLLAQFSMYLTDAQKFRILDFLYDLFLHAEEDLRKQASETFGQIIAHFDAPYGKYLPPSAPEDIFKCSKSNVLKPYCMAYMQMEDRTDAKVKRIGQALVTVFKHVISSAKQIESTVELLVDLILKSSKAEGDCFIKVLAGIRPESISDQQLNKMLPILLGFVAQLEIKKHTSLQGGAYLFDRGQPLSDDATSASRDERAIDALLAIKQLSKVHASSIQGAMTSGGLGELLDYSHYIKRTIEDTQTLHRVYHENVHITTPDEVKRRNIAGLLHYVVKGHPEEAFGSAIHCCNLLKGNLAQDVRLAAAKAIVVLNSRLNDSEHVEVVMELLRGLEIDHYAFTKYMPQTLGRLLVGLMPTHLEGILEDLMARVKSGNAALKVLILETVAHAVNAAIASKRTGALEASFLQKMLGILTSGLVQDDEAVHLAAFQGLSGTLLKTHLTSLEQRGQVFKHYSKKMATLIGDRSLSSSMEVAYAYNYSVLYHFMTEHIYEVGPLPLVTKPRAAYFQGAFDPVSLGQKGVIHALEAQDVAVYVGIDAFCWQRQTQPTLHRRKLLEMTLADCLYTYLMPRAFSVHFDKPQALDRLRTILPEGVPYLVMGEDALISHSLYKENLQAVTSWPHFLVSRKSLTAKRQQQVQKIKDMLNVVAEIDPQGYYSTITPDLVRRAIDRQLDLEDVLDAQAIHYIKAHHLYKNEPQYKSSLEQKRIDISNLDALSSRLKSTLLKDFDSELTKLKALEEAVVDSLRVVLIQEKEAGDLVAAGAYRRLSRVEYDKMEQTPVMKQDYVDLYPENTAVIELLQMNNESWRDDYNFTLQTELLVDALHQGYDYAVYWAQGGNLATEVLEALRATGFVELQSLRCLIVSLKSPVALILDAQSALKEGYRQNPALRATLKLMRSSFLKRVVKSYPGQVVLPFDRGMLYDKLVHLVTEKNLPLEGRAYGKAIAVPYGDLFKRWTLPRTITKSLHTERVYEQSLSYFEVQASPYHLPVEEQIGLLKDFEAPVILIDDILDKGLRLQGIENGFKAHGIEIERIAVGIMTALGKRRMTQRGYAVEAGYYLPNLAAWFTESLMYPFIGGDSVSTQGSQVVRFGVLQGVNRIAPYFAAPEAKSMSTSSYLQLSEMCLENSIAFMEKLEKIYEAQHQRPLTIDRLSEVFITPRMPYYGEGVMLSATSKASTQLVHDLLQLKQMTKLLTRPI